MSKQCISNEQGCKGTINKELPLSQMYIYMCMLIYLGSCVALTPPCTTSIDTTIETASCNVLCIATYYCYKYAVHMYAKYKANLQQCGTADTVTSTFVLVLLLLPCTLLYKVHAITLHSTYVLLYTHFCTIL